MVSDSYLPGPQRAALFEAVTRVPGPTVVRDVSAGRPGIGISRPAPEGSGPRAEPVVMVFDQNTYEYLGTKNKPLDASGSVDQVGDRIWWRDRERCRATPPADGRGPGAHRRGSAHQDPPQFVPIANRWICLSVARVTLAMVLPSGASNGAVAKMNAGPVPPEATLR